MSETVVHSEYFPVPIDAIESDGLGFDLYLVYERGGAVLYRSSGMSYSQMDCSELHEKGITHFYVPNVQHQKFRAAVCDQMCSAYEDEGLKREARTKIVRGSCGKMIEDFMGRPNDPGVSSTLSTMAGKFSEWCGDDQSEFSYLLDMSEHDFYTTTHMVNVGIGCTLLATEIYGAESEKVQQVSLGGLIHDVGKFGVPVDVLNKEGKLSDEEWDMIRQHPEVGAKILSEQIGISPMIIDMALSHHERIDGKGYPKGISDKEISEAARICAVVDVYDALSSSRPYRGPIPPRTVLDMMREDVGKAFDASVFEAWERVIERMLEADPGRAVDESKAPIQKLKLDSIIPSLLAQKRPEHGYMRVCRKDGPDCEASIVQTSLSEIILATESKLNMGETVTLYPESGPERHARFESTRFGSRGDTQLVFRLLLDNQLAA